MQSSIAIAALKALTEKFRPLCSSSEWSHLWGGLVSVAERHCASRDAIATHPSFDYWLDWMRRADEGERLEGLRHFQGFSAALAWACGIKGHFELLSDEHSHVHFYGSPQFLRLPPRLRLSCVTVEISRHRLTVRGKDGFSAIISRQEWAKSQPHQILDDASVQSCGPLHVQGVTVRRVAAMDLAKTKKFADVLRLAFAQIRKHDPLLFSEFRDMVQLFVPLASQAKIRSVSSSYSNMKGAICLSHSDDVELQAETLIHEFCHQKLNRLRIDTALLLSGQESLYYSPWREDARPLEGLLQGAHAFVNVSSFLIARLKRHRGQERGRKMFIIARRLMQTQMALSILKRHAATTPFGESFLQELSRQNEIFIPQVAAFPSDILQKARASCDDHRVRFSRAGSDLHAASKLISS